MILEILIIFLISSIIFPQVKINNQYGLIYRYDFDNTAFPHKNRKNGHVYKEQHYSAEQHYNDSSAILFIPSYYIPKDSINLVLYFHGWRNNIDSSLAQFNLIEQFSNSKRNGILVLPECAKNSPDSFGGKLEEKNVFNDFVKEILNKIESEFNMNYQIGDITLAGHSGAYRVISYILMHGGLTGKICSVYLFDGFYGDAEKYTYWIDNYNGKFINIYTPNGGTKLESENLIRYFSECDVPYKVIDDDNFSSDDLKDSRIIFIKSELGHNEVIHTKNQFQKFLESSL